MILLTILVGVLALAFIAIGLYRMATVYEGFWFFVLGVIAFITWIPLFIMISNVKFSNETLTGYVYSKDSKWGVNTYHIRFSENAGTDVQPSFCINSDNTEAKKMDAVVGSGKRVTVEIPSKGWYFSNDIWHCASDAKLIEVIEKEEE